MHFERESGHRDGELDVCHKWKVMREWDGSRERMFAR